MICSPELVALGSRTIASQVGMWRIGGGEDPVVIEIATDLGFSRDDVATRPSVVAAAITEYLDDLVHNP